MKKILTLFLGLIIAFNINVSANDYLYNGTKFHGYINGTIGIGAHNLSDIYLFGGEVAAGYQVAPMVNVGLSIAPTYAYYSSNVDGITVPICAQVRIDNMEKKISPTLRVKTGVSAGDIKGFTLGGGLGVRFGRFDLGVNYTEIFKDGYQCGYANLSLGVVF